MSAAVIFLKTIKRFSDPSGEITPVDSLNLTLHAGTITALMGRSGCGKTTLLRLASGLLKPDSGSVEISPNGARTSVVFQDPRLLPWKTVEENVSLALLHEPEESRIKRVSEALSRVGLLPKASAYPSELSGGQAQRAALARALSTGPDILFLDEPFASLDALTRLELQNECTELLLKENLTVFMITHDVGEALKLADRILIQSEGRIAEDIAVRLPRPRLKSSRDFQILEEKILDRLFSLPH